MSKIPNFNPIIILKGVFILFIGIGFGLLYLLYRTNVTSIAAWAALSLITLFMCYLYIQFFTDLNLTPVKAQDNSRMDKIIYNADGFDIVIPVLQQKIQVEWLAIETILYDDKPNDYDSFGERYTFMLKKPPVVSLDVSASWLNRLFGPINKNSLTLYIDDEGNADFNSLKQAIHENLKVSSIYEDSKRGKLIKETIHTEENKRTVTQQWHPKQTDYPLQLIYDAYNRDIAAILIQHGMLSAS